jgi:serine/threonine protein kinase
VYFKFSEEQIEKYHMSLKGSDLYCYDFTTKKQIKFMHSLVGCFLISPTKACNNSSHDVNESINGVIYRRIELKLSQLFKRVFFVETEPEYEAWTTNIEKVINPQRLNEFYVKDDLLGQGSFGKVYKGRSKATNEIVAIKYIDKKAMKPHEVSLQMNEIEILKTVSNNPNVIKLIEYFED